MTNNQTIDGVSRAQISDIADRIEHNYPNTAKELRALLDAPTELGEIDLTPKRLAHAENVIEQQNNLIVSLRAELVESYRVAAQPQGEPVAWMCQRRTHESGRKFLPLISFDKWTNCPDDFDVWPLYRHPPEQPAPVALDVLITGFYTTETGGGKYAINIGFRSMADMQAADAQLRELLKSR